LADLQEKIRPALESLLEPGEELRGICAATQQSTFKGQLLAVGVTDRRLILQPLDRRGESKGEPLSITRGDLADAQAQDPSGGWLTPTAPIMDAAAVTLKLRTADGQKLKLMLMRGGGPGFLGKLGGGEGQAEGVAALGRWFEG